MPMRATVSRAFMGFAILTGVGSIALAPDVSVAGCVTRCEMCEVNLHTGEAKCTNCTLTDCQPQQQ